MLVVPDVIISNQQHRDWRDGLGAMGFREGPSNFALSFSPEAAAGLADEGIAEGEIHINRGDGDGPIHL